MGANVLLKNSIKCVPPLCARFGCANAMIDGYSFEMIGWQLFDLNTLLYAVCGSGYLSRCCANGALKPNGILRYCAAPHGGLSCAVRFRGAATSPQCKITRARRPWGVNAPQSRSDTHSPHDRQRRYTLYRGKRYAPNPHVRRALYVCAAARRTRARRIDDLKIPRLDRIPE